MVELQEILENSSSRHRHLCPRQVLGARIGLAGAAALGLNVPRHDKRLLVIIETDGCFADGVEAATGCTMGHRTLRLEDYGKIGATFIDVKTETAVRIYPQLDVREKARLYALEEPRRYYAQLVGYQRIPDEELLIRQQVRLLAPVTQLISRAGKRVNCGVCGEEIINEREEWRDNLPLCQACTGSAYYSVPRSNLIESLFAKHDLNVGVTAKPGEV